MAFFHEFQKRVRAALWPVAGALMVAYFGYHLVQGNQGLRAWHALDIKIAEAKETRDALVARRDLRGGGFIGCGFGGSRHGSLIVGTENKAAVTGQHLHLFYARSAHFSISCKVLNIMTFFKFNLISVNSLRRHALHCLISAASADTLYRR